MLTCHMRRYNARQIKICAHQQELVVSLESLGISSTQEKWAISKSGLKQVIDKLNIPTSLSDLESAAKALSY